MRPQTVVYVLYILFQMIQMPLYSRAECTQLYIIMEMEEVMPGWFDISTKKLTDIEVYPFNTTEEYTMIKNNTDCVLELTCSENSEINCIPIKDVPMNASLHEFIPTMMDHDGPYNKTSETKEDTSLIPSTEESIVLPKANTEAIITTTIDKSPTLEPNISIEGTTEMELTESTGESTSSSLTSRSKCKQLYIIMEMEEFTPGLFDISTKKLSDIEVYPFNITEEYTMIKNNTDCVLELACSENLEINCTPLKEIPINASLHEFIPTEHIGPYDKSSEATENISLIPITEESIVLLKANTEAILTTTIDKSPTLEPNISIEGATEMPRTESTGNIITITEESIVLPKANTEAILTTTIDKSPTLEPNISIEGATEMPRTESTGNIITITEESIVLPKANTEAILTTTIDKSPTLEPNISIEGATEMPRTESTENIITMSPYSHVKCKQLYIIMEMEELAPGLFDISTKKLADIEAYPFNTTEEYTMIKNNTDCVLELTCSENSESTCIPLKSVMTNTSSHVYIPTNDIYTEKSTTIIEKTTTAPPTTTTEKNSTIPSTTTIEKSSSTTTTESIATVSSTPTTEKNATEPSTTTTEKSATVPPISTMNKRTTPLTTITEKSATVPPTTAKEKSTTLPQTTTTEKSTTAPSTTTTEKSTTVPSTTTTQKNTTVPSTTTTEKSTTVPSTTSTHKSTTVPSTTGTEKSTTVIPPEETTTVHDKINSTDDSMVVEADLYKMKNITKYDNKRSIKEATMIEAIVIASIGGCGFLIFIARKALNALQYGTYRLPDPVSEV